MSSDYWSLAVSLDPEAADAVANFLAEAGSTGVVEQGQGVEAGAVEAGAVEAGAEGAETAPVRLRAFFPPGTDPAETGRRFEGYLDDLRALAVPVGSGTVEITRVPAEAWADAWRAHFRPLPIGRRLLVCPPWEAPAGADGPPAARRLVVIEPGRAFGTGSHATTRACLELLERALERRPVERALDVGTGSGILAIAAARLGVPAVTALDVDPDAVAAADANAARNGVAGGVRVEMASLEAWSGPPAPLVLANLLGPALVGLAPLLARYCATPGRLIAGGLLVHEAPSVAAAFTSEGFELVEVLEHEGWAGLLFARGHAALPDPA